MKGSSMKKIVLAILFTFGSLNLLNAQSFPSDNFEAVNRIDNLIRGLQAEIYAKNSQIQELNYVRSIFVEFIWRF